MNQALAWKEWRELRGVAAAGAGIALALPLFVLAGSKAFSDRPIDVTGLADMLPALFAGILWPLLAVGAGAATFAHESGDGTLSYLIARPISRVRLWGVKVAVAGGSALAVMLVSLAIAWVAGRMAGTAGIMAQLQAPAPFAGSLLVPCASVLFLLFSLSVLFSSLLSRPLTAAAGGLAASVQVMGLIALFWWRLDVVPRLEPELLSLQILLMSFASLAASLFVVRRWETPRGAAPRDAAASALILAGAAVVAIGIVAVPLGRLAPDAATMGLAIPLPAGDALAMTAASREGYSPRVWLIHADGSGVEPLTPRLSFFPMPSPDGRWVAYVSMRGALGLRSSRGRLRVVRADGSEDRVLADDLPVSLRTDNEPPLFSPDGLRVALASGGTFVVASLHDGELWRDATQPRARLLGWTPDGMELVLLASGRLVALHAGTHRTRVLHEGSGLRTPFWWRPPRSISFVPLETGGEWVLVDTASGQTRPIEGRACGGFDQTEDGRVIAVADCHAGSIDVRVGEEVWGTYPGRSARVLLSPAADLVAVQVMDGPGHVGPLRILDSSNPVATFPAGWSPIGWAGRGRILLMNEGEHRLAMGAATSGEVSTFFPE
jgi:hypothetical protein